MESLELEEYRSLRAAIRERGTLRTALFVGTLAAWGLAAILVASLLVQPIAALVPLLVLVAGFEAVHTLHVGAERIGRYLYVRYERAMAGSKVAPSHAKPMWEAAIAAFGRGGMSAVGRPSGAHFALVFGLAITVNLLVLGLAALPQELAALGALHLVALVRVTAAHRAAANQRAHDEARFRELLG